jgi:hypothetical protein
MPVSLKKEKVVDNWNMVVERAAGRDKWVLDTVEKLVKEANMPNVGCKQDLVSTGMFSTKRTFLLVADRSLRDYCMYISARDYGAHLDVGWFLTLYASGLKAAMARHATGNPMAFSSQINLFAQQDLRAFITIAHHCVKSTVDMLYEQLKLAPPNMNTQSKGFLGVW